MNLCEWPHTGNDFCFEHLISKIDHVGNFTLSKHHSSHKRALCNGSSFRESAFNATCIFSTFKPWNFHLLMSKKPFQIGRILAATSHNAY